ncbi:MAG: prolyl oligopeptidase family serine peptidase [Steroidobacteraceae bacterium]
MGPVAREPGYAVLQVEFRGSTGHGTDWFRAGFRDWGGLPYEDVIDGTRWAIAQGRSTRHAPASSAPATAATWRCSATRNEGLFKCAVSIAGVSDLFELRNDERFFRNWEIANAGLAQDTKSRKEDSPRQHAAGVNIPILLVHGERDYTVEVDHTKMMDAALRRAGKPHQTLIIEKTDHYFREDVPRRALYTTLVRFLGEQLGTPPAPAAAPAATPACRPVASATPPARCRAAPAGRRRSPAGSRSARRAGLERRRILHLLGDHLEVQRAPLRIIAVTMVWLTLSRAVADERAVDLQVVDRRVLQVGERAEAVAEVVEREAATHAVHGDGAPRMLEVGDHGVLGDLEAHLRGAGAGGIQALDHELEELRVGERLARDVDRHRRGGSSIAPRPSAVSVVCTTRRSIMPIRR